VISDHTLPFYFQSEAAENKKTSPSEAKLKEDITPAQRSKAGTSPSHEPAKLIRQKKPIHNSTQVPNLHIFTYHQKPKKCKRLKLKATKILMSGN
jgi:hypothetical protein